jgi:hypothetical protein
MPGKMQVVGDVRNDETQHALEVAIKTERREWLPMIAPLRAALRHVDFDVAGELVLGMLRGEAVSGREIEPVTGMPHWTVSRRRAAISDTIAGIFGERPLQPGAGRRHRDAEDG